MIEKEKRKIENQSGGLSYHFVSARHARQTSKKVKAAIKTRFLSGAYYSAYAPIGYKKHPEIKGKIIPDEETRWIGEITASFRGRTSPEPD